MAYNANRRRIAAPNDNSSVPSMKFILLREVESISGCGDAAFRESQAELGEAQRA